MYMIALGMVDQPADYDEPRQSAPVQREPAMALRSDGGLSILTKHEDIRTAPVTAEEASDGTPADRPSLTTREAEESVVSNPELLGGFPVAAAEFNAEETGGVDAEKIEYPKPRPEKEKIAAIPSDQPGEGGADEVTSSAPSAGDETHTSNTGEGAANTALPAKPKHRLRPNCLDRSNCKSGTVDHCWSCKKALAEKSEEMA